MKVTGAFLCVSGVSPLIFKGIERSRALYWFLRMSGSKTNLIVVKKILGLYIILGSILPIKEEELPR